MSNFNNTLKNHLLSKSHNFYTDNYDSYRYGNLSLSKKFSNFSKRVIYSSLFLPVLVRNTFLFNKVLLRNSTRIKEYFPQLEFFYEKLEDERSKKLLLDLLSFRILGYSKVKLPFHLPEYWEMINNVEESKEEKNFLELNAKPWRLYKFDLSNFGTNFSIYYTSEGCYRCILREHYRLEVDSSLIIEAKQNDIVLDLGGCFGDTALYFADKVGKEGHVHVFEFIPGNISGLKENIALNPSLESQISLVEHPIWEHSKQTIYYKDKGAGSKVSFEDFEGSEGTSTTISIDDYVEQQNLKRVDFIKTDIEGAEPFALKGAQKTISKFKPVLAISIYHGMNDFVSIIQQINNFDLGYKFYLGHASIHIEETVLFCISDL